MYVAVGLYFLRMDEHGAGLVESIVDGKGAMTYEQPTVFAAPEGFQRYAAGAKAGGYLFHHFATIVVAAGGANSLCVFL